MGPGLCRCLCFFGPARGLIDYRNSLPKEIRILRGAETLWLRPGLDGQGDALNGLAATLVRQIDPGIDLVVPSLIRLQHGFRDHHICYAILRHAYTGYCLAAHLLEREMDLHRRRKLQALDPQHLAVIPLHQASGACVVTPILEYYCNHVSYLLVIEEQAVTPALPVAISQLLHAWAMSGILIGIVRRGVVALPLLLAICRSWIVGPGILLACCGTIWYLMLTLGQRTLIGHGVLVYMVVKFLVVHFYFWHSMYLSF